MITIPVGASFITRLPAWILPQQQHPIIMSASTATTTSWMFTRERPFDYELKSSSLFKIIPM